MAGACIGLTTASLASADENIVSRRAKLELAQDERPTTNPNSAVRRRPSTTATVLDIDQMLIQFSDSLKTPRKAASTSGASAIESGHPIGGSIDTTFSS